MPHVRLIQPVSARGDLAPVDYAYLDSLIREIIDLLEEVSSGQEADAESLSDTTTASTW